MKIIQMHTHHSRPLDPRGTPVDITEIINAVRRLKAIGPPMDTIVFIGYRVKGTAKQKKRTRFINRKLIARLAECPYLQPIPATVGIMGRIHDLRREFHDSAAKLARAQAAVIDDPASDEEGREQMRHIWRERETRRKKI